MNKHLIVGVIAVIVMALIGGTSQAIQSSYGTTISSPPRSLEDDINAAQSTSLGIKGLTISEIVDERKAPIATSGDNIYIAWPTNSTGNDEVTFRASTDNGATFADKINLSNSTGAESQDVEIAADGDNVIVTWWERNATSNEPVLKISTDNGETFGSLLRLAANGTIGGEGG